MNRKFFNLQLFALNVTVTASNTLVSGTADADTIQLGDWRNRISNVTAASGTRKRLA